MGWDFSLVLKHGEVTLDSKEREGHSRKIGGSESQAEE